MVAYFNYAYMRYSASLSYALSAMSVLLCSNMQVLHYIQYHIDDLVQDCSVSSANALEILQPCTKPSGL